MRPSGFPLNRHPGESREPLNSFRAISTARIEFIQWIPVFAGMTVLAKSAGAEAWR
jgi:hypothetical protein